MNARPALNKSMLAWLIEPVKVSDFFAEYFERQPLIVARNNPDYFAELLTLEDVDRILTVLHPTVGEIDLVKRDSPERVKSEEYVGPKGFADPARVASLFADGATVMFPALHRKLPRLAELCAGLEAEFTQPFQANVYLTPLQSQGFDVHYDSHDVFALQVAGSKTWNFYRTPIELPLHAQSFAPGEHDPGPVTRSLELRAGDVLYIPRGLMHEAKSTTDTSLHITLGVLSRTWTDFMIEAVTATCLAEPAFRKSLPLGFACEGFDRGEARKYFRELLEKLADSSDFESLLDVFADQFVGTREVPLPGQLEAMNPARKLSLLDVFEPRPHLIYRLTNEAKSRQMTLRAYGIELTLPDTMASAVRFALETPRYRAGDLPVALSPADKLTLVTRLLREGLIERKGVASA